jgi:CheY-like chemotaxis protein
MDLVTLIVDDDKIISFLHHRILSELKFPGIKVFTDSPKALKYIKENFDKEFILFLDLNMPLLDGWEFLDTLVEEELDKNINVYIVSSSIDERDNKKSNDYNSVRAFLEKPLTSSKLKLIKSKYLQRQNEY